MSHDDKELPRVSFTEFGKGITISVEMFYHRILFLVSGKVKYGLEDKKPGPVHGRNMLYVSPNIRLSLRATEPCQVVIIYTEHLIELCECFDKTEGKPYNDEILRTPPGIMEIHPRLLLYLTNFRIFYQDGMRCKYYLLTKIEEMYYLIRAYYERMEIKRFFSLLGDEEREFSNKIITNWRRFRSVRQLAEFMNCSESAFTRKFKSVFGENAGRWLANKRKEAIWYDLTVGRDPLKVLAEKYLFSTQGLFSDFCRNNFGRSPGEIRKHKGKMVISKK
ncbi:MAG: helix-turn-helix domain-containing protein [Bacteroides sp.]|nr:helix-turn-helix domain-containing protein [Bacteroides sp.]